MEKHYFIGEGPEAEKLISAMLEREKVAREARNSLMNDYGIDRLYLWRDGSVASLGFKEKTDASFLKGGKKKSDGLYSYLPKLNTKAGKELAMRLKDENLTFSVSNFILDSLNLHRSSFDSFKMFVSVAGVTKDKKILVLIPGTKEKSPECPDPFPAVPEWLLEVKESEFLAALGM